LRLIPDPLPKWCAFFAKLGRFLLELEVRKVSSSLASSQSSLASKPELFSNGYPTKLVWRWRCTRSHTTRANHRGNFCDRLANCCWGLSGHFNSAPYRGLYWDRCGPCGLCNSSSLANSRDKRRNLAGHLTNDLDGLLACLSPWREGQLTSSFHCFLFYQPNRVLSAELTAQNRLSKPF
jgi:hypothetical protein